MTFAAAITKRLFQAVLLNEQKFYPMFNSAAVIVCVAYPFLKHCNGNGN